MRALASYERTQLSFDSPFDHFAAGDANAIDASARRGWELFNTRGRCNKCHALTEEKRDLTNFTDNDFHNIGIGIIRHDVVALARQAGRLINSQDAAAVDRAAIQTDMSALGRFLITRKEADIAAFKTPNLRNILVTGPYFHDGSQATLWDAMDHYNKGAGLQNPYLDQDIQPLALTEDEIDDSVWLQRMLTSPDYMDRAVELRYSVGAFRGPIARSATRPGPSARNCPSRSRPPLEHPHSIAADYSNVVIPATARPPPRLIGAAPGIGLV